MANPRLLPRLLLILCLQFQALAALAMPCAHVSVDPQAGAAEACHHSHLPPAPSDADRSGPCAKCALAGIVTSYPPAAGPTPGVHPSEPILVTAPAAHFYRHIPPPAPRPPTPAA